jgi:hypothetical protein
MDKKLNDIVRYITPEVLDSIQNILSINLNSLDRVITPKFVVGIYFLYDNNELVYIGKSTNIHIRINTHRKNKQFDSYSILKCCEDDLKIYERILINKYLPKYNIDMVTKKIKNK